MRIAWQLMGGPQLTPVRAYNWLVAIKYHSTEALFSSKLELLLVVVDAHLNDSYI